MTVAFAVYFREVVVGAADNRADQLWGLANFLAMLVVALAAPVLGAMADRSGRRKTLLVACTLQTALATALLAFATPGRVVLAMALYVVATIGFEAGYVVYNAFLPEIAPADRLGRISGWAWGIGFVGGLAALLMCAPWIASELRGADGALSASAARDRRFAFTLVAAFQLLFSLPAFLWLHDRPCAARPGLGRLAAEGGRRVIRTLHELRRYREAGKFVLASLCFTDAITTVIVFAATYATVTFGFGSRELVVLFVAMNLVAFPATVASGYLADALGARRTLVLSLVLWMGIVCLAFGARTKGLFWVTAVGAAAGMGATQAVGRSFMAQISPRERVAEFFGFYVTSGKFAAVSGPLLFGTLSAWTGSQRIAVLSLLPLFGLALWLMLRIDENAARAAASAPAPR